MSTNFLMPLMMLVGPEGDQAEWEHHVGNQAIKLPVTGDESGEVVFFFPN